MRRHVLTEEHHVRLQLATAALAVDDVETCHLLVGEGGVAIRVDLGHGCVPAGGRLPQPLAEFLAGCAVAAAQTDDAVHAAVQLDHATGARRLVQAIDVLGDDPREQPASLELRDRVMPRVRDRASDVPPPNVATRPVPLAARGTACANLGGHRLRPAGPTTWG